jgi:outer membrane murein-binding lipoprotein Lpp
MADSGAMRTGRMVVRYHSPWRRRSVLICAIALAIIMLYGFYEWGRFEGGYSKFAEVQQRRELNAKVEALEETNAKLRGDVAAAELARDVDRKAYADVERDLADLQAKVLKHQEELTFYRGIVSPEDGIGGLRIQRFQVLPGDVENSFRLRILLVQSMRQDAMVSGQVLLQIEGVRDNKPAQLTLAEVGGETRGDGQVPFQFRYFQNLEQAVTMPTEFTPKAVNIEVRSGRATPVRESFPWQVQAES